MTQTKPAEPETQQDEPATFAGPNLVVRLGGGLLRSSTGLLFIASLVVLVAFAIALRDTAFLSSTNLSSVARQTTTICVMAVGTVFVLSAGEIDLSFAPVIALSGLVAAKTMETFTWPFAVLAALAVGAIVGAANASITVFLKIPSFITTLGTLGVITGISQSYTDLKSVPVTNTQFLGVFGTATFGAVSILLVWILAAVVVGELVLRTTVFGRRVLATGGNPIASRYSGVGVKRVRFAVLMISSVTASLVGLLYVGRLSTANYTQGAGDLLPVLSAVIIGGTALSGGRGNVFGAVVGALLVGLINNGLILLGLSSAQQQIFSGIVIVVAVALTGVRSLIGRAAPA
jgi:ribose transport system permease protein